MIYDTGRGRLAWLNCRLNKFFDAVLNVWVASEKRWRIPISVLKTLLHVQESIVLPLKRYHAI